MFEKSPFGFNSVTFWHSRLLSLRATGGCAAISFLHCRYDEIDDFMRFCKPGLEFPHVRPPGYQVIRGNGRVVGCVQL